MKTLYLLRHAKSSWKDLDCDDFDRPLNKRGKGDAPVMGGVLRLRGVAPDVLLTSPARRARKTVKAIVPALDLKDDRILEDMRLYDATVDELLRVIYLLPDSAATVLICGHNEGLTHLANLLCRRPVTDNVPTCGVVGLRFPVETWAEVRPHSAVLLFFDFPKRHVSPPDAVQL